MSLQGILRNFVSHWNFFTVHVMYMLGIFIMANNAKGCSYSIKSFIFLDALPQSFQKVSTDSEPLSSAQFEGFIVTMLLCVML